MNVALHNNPLGKNGSASTGNLYLLLAALPSIEPKWSFFHFKNIDI